MIAAAAQIPDFHGDITQGINDHLNWVRKASEKGAQLILFPEMSLTGYKREEAEKLSFTFEVSRLSPLEKASRDLGIIIVAGAPLKDED